MLPDFIITLSTYTINAFRLYHCKFTRPLNILFIFKDAIKNVTDTLASVDLRASRYIIVGELQDMRAFFKRIA